MSLFDPIPEIPGDPLFDLAARYKQDPRPEKCTLVTGYYRNENLEVPVLNCVAQVEREMAEERIPRRYLPIDGDVEMANEIGKLVFGPHWNEEKIFSMHTVGGTGALYLCGVLTRHFTDCIAISKQTWVNHWKIFSSLGFKTESYPYYKERKLAFDWMIEKLRALPERVCVLLHTNCHNPTSLDPTKEEWKQISDICKEKRLFPVFDMAYHGFTDTPDADAYAPRLFLEEGHEFALTYSCSKNFSLYSERIGSLFVVSHSPKPLPAIRSQLKSEARRIYSNPPFHGAHIVKTILQTPSFKKKWLEELREIRKRMDEVRTQLSERLSAKDPDGGWETLCKGRGPFCMSDLSPEATKKLRDEFAFYILFDGRINLSGLNQKNLPSFADALIEVAK